MPRCLRGPPCAETRARSAPRDRGLARGVSCLARRTTRAPRPGVPMPALRRPPRRRRDQRGAAQRLCRDVAFFRRAGPALRRTPAVASVRSAVRSPPAGSTLTSPGARRPLAQTPRFPRRPAAHRLRGAGAAVAGQQRDPEPDHRNSDLRRRLEKGREAAGCVRQVCEVRGRDGLRQGRGPRADGDDTDRRRHGGIAAIHADGRRGAAPGGRRQGAHAAGTAASAADLQRDQGRVRAALRRARLAPQRGRGLRLLHRQHRPGRSGTEAEAAAPNRLFDALAATLAGSPDLACASNADKAVLNDTRIANTGLPLLYYLDGTKTRTAAEIEQARALAAASSRRILHAEPAALVAMLPTAAPMRQAPHQPRGGAAGVGGGGCSCASRRTMAPAVARITCAPADALPRSPPGPRGTAGARAARPA